MYAWSEWDDNLYIIDIATGAPTLVGQSGASTYQTGLAVNDAGIIYMKAGDELYTVNPTNGQATFLILLSGSPQNLLAFNTSGELFTGLRNQAPNVFLVGGRKAVRLQGSKVTVQFASSDDWTSSSALDIKCSLNGANYDTCSSPFQAELPSGSYELRVMAIDEHLAESQELIVNFTIKSKKLKSANVLELEVESVSQE